MAIESIVRAKGGTAEREVQVSDIVIHDIRTSPLFLPDERWITTVKRYYEDLGLLLGSVRANLEVPSEFFVIPCPIGLLAMATGPSRSALAL